jgi:hypothetical protein
MNGTSETTTPSTPNVLTSVNNEANKRAKEAIFVLCETCYWAATFINKSKLNIIENGCIMCNESLVSSFPILDNESFTFDYSERRGVELNFGVRRNKK